MSMSFIAAPDIVCSSCGTRGTAKKVTKGSFILELFLFCCFFLPGLCYAIWRSSTRYKACRTCGSTHIVPLNSPMGKELCARYPAPAAAVAAAPAVPADQPAIW